MSTLRRMLSRPFFRQSVKLGLDLLLAGMAWAISEQFLADHQGKTWHIWGWMALALVIDLLFSLTRQHYRFIGFKDALRLATASLSLCLGAIALSYGSPRLALVFQHDVVVTASLLTALGWATLRGTARARYDQFVDGAAASEGPARRRTLIIGAGRAGLLVAQELRRHPELGCKVVGFVDDAFDKQGLLIQGIPVMGPPKLLPNLVQEHGINQVVLAMPSAPGRVIRALSDQARSLSLAIKTVPGVYDLLGPRTWKPDLRDISIEDLLRREPVRLDQTTLAEELEDRVVLVTGGGGSIGSEIARQVAAFRPARLVLLGRGENSLWEAERSIRGLFPNQGLSLELCDIRNSTRLQQVFERWKPQVVFHAAAHKHVPYLEVHPEEAIENNIFGTWNVAQAAHSVGTRFFVNISTDKAVNPTNVLGATKRLAEHLVCRVATQAGEGARFVSVRFGNVLGSRGSVIPIFRDQIQQGGPITVTHPDMTRYFMTIPEASQLVLQAGLLGETGRVYVLDMGEPVRIVDLATDMAKLSGLVPGQDVEITFTGIRPGEKLFEELFMPEELAQSHVHPKVFGATSEPIDHALLEAGLADLKVKLLGPDGTRQRDILHWLKRLVPTYTPSPTGLGRFDEAARDHHRASGSHPVFTLES